MKSLKVLFFACCACLAFGQEPTFRWGFPPLADLQKITPANFPDVDAVIILKEQGFSEGPHTKNLLAIYNETTVSSIAVIVKLFNEKAVETFGSFSYELPDIRVKEDRHVFTVRVRVLKPDSTIQVLADSSIKRITGISSGHGRALTQRVMYKIPNLAPGDIVQYEYTHAEPWSFKRQVLYFYHDRYPVIRSVVYVNMTTQEKVKYLNFPPEKFGPADVKDLGRAISSSWTLSNLAAVPDEPFGRPLAEVSYLTTVVNQDVDVDNRGWSNVAKDYYRDNIDQGSVPKSFMRDLGMNPTLENPSWTDIDSLYTALRKYFRLKSSSERYTDEKAVDQQIDDKEGDASDVAFIMLKALDRWGIHATPVLVRDRRDGGYELTVPSLVWFDRLALLVSFNGKDQLYDFDRCIPSRYEVPWFINPSVMFAVQDTGGYHFQLKVPSSWREHISAEEHQITLKPGKRAADSVTFVLKGALAQHERGSLYTMAGEDLDKALRSYLGDALQDVEHTSINDFRDNTVVQISGWGTSRAASATIDSFLTFQPRNHLFRSFRDKFSKPTRQYDIRLDEPFGNVISWQVKVPERFEVAQLPEGADISGPAGAMAQVSYLQQEGSVNVKAMVVFSSSMIPLAKYAEWRSFLENVNSSMEREIAFRLSRKP